MFRTIFAILAGVLAAMLLMFGVEALGMALFPPASGTVPQTEADLARLVAEASVEKKAMVVLGWALASFIGGWVAAKLARHPRAAAIAVGGLILAGCIMNAVRIPHPLWMNALGVLLPIPLALLGARLARAGAQSPGAEA